MTRTLCLAATALLGSLLPAVASARALTVDTADESQVPHTVDAAASKPPQGPFPPPPPQGGSRSVSFALLAGPGWLALRDDLGRDGQQATSLAARLGVVIGPEWNLILSVEHARTERGHITFSQTAGTMGVQRFLFERLYLGGALGLAWVREHASEGLSDGPGGTVSGHLGVELLRSQRVALAAEVSFTLAQYQKEKWEMGGVRLGLLLF
jgi:hypothetical protein